VVLAVENLTLEFEGLRALSGVGFGVDAGTLTALVGPNGAGKTSLLNCVSGFYAPTRGRVTFEGRHLSGQPPHRVAAYGVARVFQFVELFRHMTVLDNVLLGPRFAQRVSVADAEALGRRLLARVGLEAKMSAYPAQLSGGQQQRVAIARALAMRPKVLLLDEITSALDPELVGEVEDVIRGLLRDRIMMVLVTHALGFAREVAHRIAYLADGAIVELGSPADVLDRPKDPGLKEFLRRVR
jgi:ABC-type polar amino acid transport system ATPase subunit